MGPVKAKRHPAERPRGVRDARKCMAQAGGRLAWVQDGQPMFWSDRPRKFAGHILLMLTKHGGTAIEDIKWHQLGSTTWWRLPEFPDGTASTPPGEEHRLAARARLKGRVPR